MKKKIILLGAGGHAKVVIDNLDLSTYEIVGLIDRNKKNLYKLVNNVPVIDIDENLHSYYPCKATVAFVAIGHIGNYQIRNAAFSKVKNIGFELHNIVHPTAVLSPSVSIGHGNLIMPNTVINADSCLGENNILNTGSIIEHDVIIGNGVHIAPGATVCGGSQIFDNVFLGAGSVVIQGIKIGHNSTIGAGSVITSDIPPDVVVTGVPARIIKRRT